MANDWFKLSQQNDRLNVTVCFCDYVLCFLLEIHFTKVKLKFQKFLFLNYTGNQASS